MSTLLPPSLEPAQPTPVPMSGPLPREIVLALANWQNLRKNGWTLTDAMATLEGLLRAGELALESGRESLSRALDAFSLYFGFLVDSEVTTLNPAQSQTLAKLEGAVLGLLRAEQSERQMAAPVSERKVILLLAPDLPFWQAIADRLDGGAFRIEHFANPDALMLRLNARIPSAVLIDQDFLPDLPTVADRLERSHEAGTLGTTLLYFNRSRDSRARGLALAGPS